MLVKCPRCGGKGIIPSYMHVDNGVCFLCEGTKYIEQAEAEKFIMQEAKKDENRAKKNAKLEAYRKAERERIDKQREEWKNKKNQPIVKAEQEQQPFIYEGSADQALDEFFNYIDEK